MEPSEDKQDQAPDEQNRSFMDEFQAFSRLVLKRFGEDQCLRISAALSYTTLLALVPLGAIAFSILWAFPVFDDIQGQIKALLFQNFFPESVAGAGSDFNHFVSRTKGLTAVGIIALEGAQGISMGRTLRAVFEGEK